MNYPPRNVSSLPAAVQLVPARVRGEVANRLMVILRAPGCAYDRRAPGGCTFCSFRRLTTHGIHVTASDLITQTDAALAGRDFIRERIFEIDLYNSGSFFNDDEIPSEARVSIVARCAREPAVQVVLVESRPEYITAHRIADLYQVVLRLRKSLTIEVGIGLESVNDTIREIGLNKGFSRKAFERAVSILGETGADLLAYVLLKPLPMSDREAIDEAYRTAEYVHEIATRHGVRARIALESTFVVPGTPLADAFANGSYRPPSLWSVLETTRKIAPLGDLVVGLSDEGLQPLVVPDSCLVCHDRIVTALRRFNVTQAPAELNIAKCECSYS